MMTMMVMTMTMRSGLNEEGVQSESEGEEASEANVVALDPDDK